MKQSDAVAGTAVDADAQSEISQAWRQVELRVIQMAGGDATKINKRLNIDAVLEQLKSAQAKDKKAAEKYATIKNIFNGTLQCIQTVGGIITTHVAAVFAPASTCYNALSFVITAWQGYEGIFDGLAALLSKCTEFLDRLSYYTSGGMDIKLTRVACEHLDFFVKICDRSLEMRRTGHKFAAFLKTLFLNDNGVKSLLGAMEGLVDKERGLVAAQTWKSSTEAAAHSKEAAETSRDTLALTRVVQSTLAEEKTTVKREKEALAWRQSIVDTLECDESILDATEAKPWDKAWKRHRDKVASGSGEWLLEDRRFRSWIEGTGTSNGILGLQGGDGSGKTLLASNVILNLRTGKAGAIKDLGTRIVVAHDFLDFDSKASKVDADTGFISRHVLCQLALEYEPLTKSVAAVCDRYKDFRDALTMWTQLLFENEDLVSMDVTLFIVLDGLKENTKAFIRILKDFAKAEGLMEKIRILVTGTGETFAAFDQAGVKHEKIVISHYNKQDVEVYIKDRMDKMDILRETSRPGVTDIRNKVLERLVDSTNGDYYKINHVLDNISKTDDIDEINACLDSAGSTLPDQIEDELQTLNQIRSNKEINEINELILWISTAQWWLDAETLEGALELGLGAGSSLMSLRAKIESKYTIFAVQENIVEYKVEGIEQKIQLKAAPSSTQLSITESTEITPGEVRILKHYLSTVCPPDLYSKFGFDEFFDAKLVRKGVCIHRDADNAHIALALRCLRGLVEPRNKMRELALSYCQNSLLYHLSNTDLSLADRVLKEEVGEMLVRLFTEREAFCSFLGIQIGEKEDPKMIPKHWGGWVETDRGVEMLSKWFKDSAVINRVKDHSFIKAFNSADVDKRLMALFDEAAKNIAGDLFQKDTIRNDTLLAFGFVYTVLTRKVHCDPEVIREPTIEMVQLVEDFAKKATGTTIPDASWDARASDLLATIAGENVLRSKAEERARMALSRDPSSWRASYALARVIESREESIQLLKDVIAALKTDDQWLTDEQHRLLLARITFELGELFWEEGKNDEAIATYATILNIDRSFNGLLHFADVLPKYEQNESWDAIVNIFDQFVQMSQEENNKIGSFFYDRLQYGGVPFRSLVARAVESTNRLDLVQSIIDTVYLEGPSPGQMVDLRFNQGLILMQIKGQEKAALDIWEENLNVASEAQRTTAIELFLPTWIRLLGLESTAPLDKEVYRRKIETCYEEYESAILRDDSLSLCMSGYFHVWSESSRAKRLIRRRVREALEMLADDDLSNDNTSLWNLNKAFSIVRDIPNIHATGELMDQAMRAEKLEFRRKKEAWRRKQAAETNKNKENGEEDGKAEDGQAEELDDENIWWYRGKQPSDDDIDSEPDDERFIIQCDGCGNTYESLRGLWQCLTDVGNVQFDDECYEKMKNGSLNFMDCAASHDFIQLMVYKDDEKKEVKRGCVRVGDEVITYEQWKARLRAEYVDYE